MQAYNRALLKHLMCGETQVAADVPDLGAEARRSEACETLLRLLPFSWFEAGPQDPLDHYCPPGCCASRTEAVSKVSACIRSVFFTLLPRIPALNKWNKMHQPAVWWLTACKAAGGIVAHCFAALSVELQDWAELPLLREDHAIGLDDKEAYRVRQGIRFRKAAAFLNDAVNAKRLAIAVVGMTACLPELGGFFNASRLDTPGNVIKWCHESSSPGVRALSRLSQLLLTPWIAAVVHLAWRAGMERGGAPHLRIIIVRFDRKYIPSDCPPVQEVPLASWEACAQRGRRPRTVGDRNRDASVRAMLL